MKKWKVLKNNKELLGEKSIEDIIKILLENRSLSSVAQQDEFLNPRLESVTFENVSISSQEVEKTIERLKRAIKNNEAIVIYGDYDVDGICGTAILWETIYSFYKNVHPYIPHRVDEGYGLSIKGIQNLESETKNIGLIITVDNGIVAHKAVEYANTKGIDIIITDHHVGGEKNPDAFSIVHTTKLCGTSVAYLLAQEISKKIHNSESILQNSLELVALATVADLVPLKIHNRTLLKYGLIKLKKTQRKGILKLLQEAKVNKEDIDVYHIGHMIAPRLNASGRISHAMDSLRLICTTDETRALKLARILEETNKERQNLTFDSATHAKESVGKAKLDNVLIAASDVYDQGVVGLIASKLVEEFYRPSIAISIGDIISKGSARSIPGVNIIELIRSVPEFLKEAGGHPMAAGFSIETKNLDGFKTALIKKANDQISSELFDRVLKIDTELPFNLIDQKLYDAIQTLAPFGMENPAPIFATKGVTVISTNRVGKNKEHMQLMFEKDAVFFKGIVFRYDGEDIKQGEVVNIAYSIERNEWNGKTTTELRIKDII